MYINFINDRKSLGYEVLRDTAYEIKVCAFFIGN
jgi:hypothetical protein